MSDDARFGLLLDDEYTQKMLEICEYKGVHPYDLFIESIDRMYDYLQEVKKRDGR